jgi:hypothetical protein
MRSRPLLGCFLGGALAFSALAAAQQQNSVTVKVDGADLDGVVGYRLEFVRQPAPKADSRRLDLAYAPNQRTLFLTVTQKGLKGLQEWLNLITEGGVATAKVVTLTQKNETGDVLITWELSGVVPTTLSQASSGTTTDITATLEFLFDRMRLVDASTK